mmetsp:Transcript_23001/g.33371  ORF Transcript_23001/g.33371 Transcript_23001/m.33371 type:complete len:246 (-) Transcript_23001:578-1315(-)
MVLQKTSVLWAGTVARSSVRASRLWRNPLSSVCFSPHGPEQSTITWSKFGDTRCSPGPRMVLMSGNSSFTCSTTSSGRVAVTNTNCVFMGALTPTWFRLKFSSRYSTSTSSSTMEVVEDRSRAPRSSREFRRPGVATTMSRPCFCSRRACCLGSYCWPVKHMEVSLIWADRPLTTWCTCTASSAVGARMMTRGLPGWARAASPKCCSSSRSRCMMGSKYARVFPLPVWSASRHESPDRTVRYAND